MSEENLLNSEPVVSEPVVSESPAVTNVEAPSEFISTISEDLRSNANLKDFKDVNQLAKSYVELQRMVGNSVRIPSQDSSEEVKSDFLSKIKDVDGVLLKGDENLYNKLGRPETADNYDLSGIVNPEIASAVPGIEQELGDFKSIAHEIGLTNEQAQKLVGMRMSTVTAQQEQQAATYADAEATMKQAWGPEFENRLSSAKLVAKTYREKYGEQVDALIDGPAGNNPAFLSMLDELAGVYKEKGHTGLSSANFGMTPEGALAKIYEKRADRGFMEAYLDGGHIGHNKAKMEMRKLYDLADGSKQ